MLSKYFVLTVLLVVHPWGLKPRGMLNVASLSEMRLHNLTASQLVKKFSSFTKRTVRYRARNIPPLPAVLSQINPVRLLILFKIQFHIIIYATFFLEAILPKILYAFAFSPVPVTCAPSILDFIAWPSCFYAVCSTLLSPPSPQARIHPAAPL